MIQTAEILELKSRLAKKLATVLSVNKARCERRGFDENSIGILATKSLLEGLENAASNNDWNRLLGGFEATMMGYSPIVQQLELEERLPLGFSTEIYDLTRTLQTLPYPSVIPKKLPAWKRISKRVWGFCLWLNGES